jgi:hypothetical protein
MDRRGETGRNQRGKSNTSYIADIITALTETRGFEEVGPLG